MSDRAPAPAAGAHVPALDGIRGLAILLVMLVHFIGDAAPASSAERAAVKLANYGVWGVDLFFVLSGFLITGILLRTRGEPRYFRDFYVRRTLRIFPLYYGVLILLLGVLPRLLRSYPGGLQVSADHAGWLFSYTTNIYLAMKDAWALPYVGHFWSLAVEEHFYLVWPLCVFLLPEGALGVLSGGLAIGALALRIGLASRGVGAIPILVLTPCRLDALTVGALLAILRLRFGGEGTGAFSRRALAPLALVILGLSMWNVRAGSAAPSCVPLRSFVLAVFFAALIGATALPVRSGGALRRAFGSASLRALGRYSYGLYVFHGIVAYAMFDRHVDVWLVESLRSRPLGLVAFALLGAVTSLLIAVASYELFEAPLLRLKDRFAPSRAQRDALPRPAVDASSGVVAE